MSSWITALNLVSMNTLKEKEEIWRGNDGTVSTKCRLLFLCDGDWSTMNLVGQCLVSKIHKDDPTGAAWPRSFVWRTPAKGTPRAQHMRILMTRNRLCALYLHFGFHWAWTDIYEYTHSLAFKCILLTLRFFATTPACTFWCTAGIAERFYTHIHETMYSVDIWNFSIF